MDITCISDLHGHYPEMEGGDLLIIAGDLTACDDLKGWFDFYEWLYELPEKYQKVIYIAGNHDGALELESPHITRPHITYLCDSGTEFMGYKIWGSPYTPTFCNWHFMRNRGKDICKHWDMIPNDTNILITHGPPHGILDHVAEGGKLISVGCEDLYRKVDEIKPILHVFGHVHEGYGEIQREHTMFVNCSHVNENYEPLNKPIRVIL